MLVAFRYGNIETDSQKSFTELEFEKAKELSIPKFIYFLEDESPFPPKFDDTGSELIKLMHLSRALEEILLLITLPLQKTWQKKFGQIYKINCLL